MVIFSAATLDDKELAKKKYVLVRKQKTHDFLLHLIAYNSSYKPLGEPNSEFIDSMDDARILDELVEDDGDDGQLIKAAEYDTDRVHNGSSGLSNNIVLSSGMFHICHDGVADPVTIDDLAINENGNLQKLRVINSNNYLSESDPSYYSSAFPHLFPYGIGTPNCYRDVRVSVEESLRHLITLNDRKFAQDDVFVLAGFDRIARRKATNRLYIKLKSEPSVISAAVDVSKEQMGALLQHNKVVKQAIRTGRAIPNVPNDLVYADRVFKSIQSVAGWTYGTNEERKKMSRIVIAYRQVNRLMLHYDSLFLIIIVYVRSSAVLP